MKMSKELIEYVEESCDVDEFDGDLRCKKCGCSVHINWFEQTITCQGCDKL